MKKFVFALMAVFALGMSSCNHDKAATNVGTTDSTAIAVDSTSVDTVSTDSVVVI